MKRRYPGIEELLDGRKRIRLRAVDPRTGRMKEVDKITTGTIQQAVKLREQWRDEIRDADRVVKEVPRLGAYAESWIASKALALKPSSGTWYADRLDKHVLPVLGDFFLDKITNEDLRNLQANLAGAMAPASVNGIMAVLKMVLGDAVVEYELPRNPGQRLRALPVRKWDDENPNILSAQELGRVLGGVREKAPQHYPLVATLAFTGLRFGEASSLKWDDIDEKAGLIRVKRAQWRGRVSTTKTGKTRSVPLVPELAVVLREHRERLVSRQALGLDDGWVFPSAVGGLHPKEVLREPLKKALKHAGIVRRFTVHGFRRTFNNLSRQVAGEIVTRSITGHVTQSMTEHYSHVGGEEKLAAAGQIVRLVFAPAEKKSDDATARGGSGGGSKGPEGEGAKNEAA
jgi:integrase